MRISKIMLLCFFVVTVTLTSSATGQPRNRQPGAHGPPTPAQIEKRVKKLRAKVLRDKVGLSEDEATKVEAIFQRHGSDRTKAMDQIQRGKRALRRLLKSDSNDQAAYDAALSKAHDGHLAMQRIRERQFDELRKLLNPKQQALLLRELQQMKRKVQEFKRKRRGKGGPGKRGAGRPGRGGNARP